VVGLRIRNLNEKRKLGLYLPFYKSD
jgi:hypothetical protein